MRKINSRGPCLWDGCDKTVTEPRHYCAKHRKLLPQPDSICAGCGNNSHGNLFCDDCGKPLVKHGKRLLATEEYSGKVRTLIDKKHLTLEQAEARAGQRPIPYSDIHQ